MDELYINEIEDLNRKCLAIKRVLVNKYIWMIIKQNFMFTYESIERKSKYNYDRAKRNHGKLVLKKYDEIDLSWICENGYFHLAADKFKKLGAHWLLSEADCLVSANCKAFVRGMGSVDDSMVVMAYRRRQNLFDRACHVIDAAAEIGNMKLLQFFHAETKGKAVTSYTDAAVHLAATNGHLEALDFLYKNGYKFNSEYGHTLSDASAGRGHLAVVKYLYENSISIPSQNAFISASMCGSVEIVKYLIKVEPKVGKKYLQHMFDAAAVNGWLDLIKYFHTLGIEPKGASAINGAAANGHFEVVAYIDFHFPTLSATIQAINLAAENGHIVIVKFLAQCRKEGWTSKAVDSAATNGHLAIVKFLTHIDRKRFTNAALTGCIENGHHQIFIYLISLGTVKISCYIREYVTKSAEKGHLKILSFLMETPEIAATIPAETPNYAFQLAAVQQHMEIVSYLIGKLDMNETQITQIIAVLKNKGMKEVSDYLTAQLPNILNK